MKNKDGFVDETIIWPSSDLLSSWNISNSVVTAWILNSLSKEISASVNLADSTREIWLDFQEWYKQNNQSRIYQIQRELTSLSKDQNSITTYYAKLKTLWNKLETYHPFYSYGKCSCGEVNNL